MARSYEPDPYQADYERQKAAGFPSQKNMAGFPSQGKHGARPSMGRTRPSLLVTWGGFGIGTFVGGLAAVIAAVIIHDHAAYPNSLCNTGLGQLGQAFSTTAQTDCNTAGIAESAVGWLVFFGVGAMIVGLAKVGLGLAEGLFTPVQGPGVKRPTTTRAATTQAGTTQAGTTQAGAPAATQAPYESAPTPPPAA